MFKKSIFITLFGILLIMVISSCGDNFKNKEKVAVYDFNISKAKEWFLNQHKDLKNSYFDGQFGVDSHPAGWDRGAYLRAYIDMYEATKDINILRKLNELLKIVADGNDIITGRIDERTGTVLPGWGYRGYDFGKSGEKRYSEMLTNALYAYPLAAFARIVKENPTLQAEFGYDANRYYSMVEEIYNVYNPFVEDKKSIYKDGSLGVYVALPRNFIANSIDYTNVEAPINYTVIIAEPLIELYRASVADGNLDNQFKDLITKVGNYLWVNMQIRECRNGDKFLTWYYWRGDIDNNTKTRMEDLTHGAKLAQFVVSLSKSGLQTKWDSTKLHYLANSFTCSIVIKDNTFANYIDGTGGIYKDDAATLYDWLELQPYSSSSYQNSIAYYIKEAMQNNGDDEYYNLAVVAKFVRFVAKTIKHKIYIRD